MLNRKQNNVTNIYAHIRLLLDYTLIHMLPITGLYTYILFSCTTLFNGHVG